VRGVRGARGERGNAPSILGPMLFSFASSGPELYPWDWLDCLRWNSTLFCLVD
jgi:hypothetical protein